MRKGYVVFVIAVGLVVVWLLNSIQKSTEKIYNDDMSLETNRLKLESPAFENNGRIPPKYTCDGEDLNPPLAVSGTPQKTKSLVLIMDDPDAPRGTWDHWLLWNIPPETRKIKEGETPAGSEEGMNSWPKKGYGGPCPPSGTHRYFFKLYAIDKTLDLKDTASKKELEKAISGSILNQATLVGIYSR